MNETAEISVVVVFVLQQCICFCVCIVCYRICNLFMLLLYSGTKTARYWFMNDATGFLEQGELAVYAGQTFFAV